MLQVEHLEFWYRRNTPVLKDISLSVKKGDILCLLGPNGTGKTTLLRCILGLQHPKNGHICLNGEDLLQLSAKRRARHIAYVPQSSALSFPYCVRDVVLMGRLSHMATGAAHSAEDKRVVMDCLDKLQISHLADCSFQELSGGERQMVLVARGLAQQSSLLVMDEPTASLDYSNQIKILKTIRSLSSQGYTILMTTHFPDHAFLACTVAALMRGGYVAAYGPPDEVVTSESLSSLYQSKVCVTEADIGGKTAKVCMPLMD